VTPRVLTVLAIVVALAGCAAAVREPPATYEVLLERAKARPADVDFGALRMAYARSEHYRPYSVYPDGGDELRDAYRRNDWPRVLQIAETSLALNYVRIRPHFYAMRAHRALGDAAATAHHRAFMEGLSRSILASGDGLTPETAMLVIDIQEEYDAMAFLGVRSRMQTLVAGPRGPLDRHTVEDGTGSRASLYFDVALPLARAPGRPPSK
jgi:hypothetical protein